MKFSVAVKIKLPDAPPGGPVMEAPMGTVEAV